MDEVWYRGGGWAGDPVGRVCPICSGRGGQSLCHGANLLPAPRVVLDPALSVELCIELLLYITEYNVVLFLLHSA